jgi:hypothetical protein
METNTLHTTLIAKKQKLQEVASSLKQRFLGLDTVVDEVFSLLMPWYLFPEAQLRPTVINLWGLTGSGKTALVQAIVELLDHRKLYTHIDMGEFESDSASWIKSIFTDDLSYFHEKPALICLDEFQFAKTLDAHNNELGKDKLRVIWDLLDSGKIEYIPGHSTYYLFRADNCLKRLDKAIRAKVVLESGLVKSELDTFLREFSGFYFDRDSKEITERYFLSDDFIDGVYNLFDNEEYSKQQIKERIMMSTIEEVAVFLLEGMHSRPATKTLDLSHSLIFVLGNLDEAYSMSHSMNPDISADEFHEQTSKITVAHIKRALRKRFRAEQIARLGNNHVIYKSFNSAQFRLLIRQELHRVGTFVANKFGWKISFDETVVNIVYAEGVFPAQGTRPVLTTVKNLIESKISSLVVSILEYQLPVEEIVWIFDNGNFVFTLKDKQGIVLSVISDDAKLKLENLRKSVDPELQAHTAVHEAGHAVLAALTLRIVPSVVVSRTASDAEGFCLVTFPKGPMTKETLKKDIVICLGGYVAERMIFGETLTCSGVYSDIQEASALANKAIRQFAMGTDPIYLAVNAAQNEDAFLLSEKYALEAIRIIKECEIEAEQILLRNKLLLLKIAEYLTIHSKMEEPLIEKFVKKYGKEHWLKKEGLIKKEQYYQFNTIMQQQLRALEDEEVNGVIEEIIADVKEKSVA